jgi:hypothetical protein
MLKVEYGNFLTLMQLDTSAPDDDTPPTIIPTVDVAKPGNPGPFMESGNSFIVLTITEHWAPFSKSSNYDLFYLVNGRAGKAESPKAFVLFLPSHTVSPPRRQ